VLPRLRATPNFVRTRGGALDEECNAVSEALSGLKVDIAAIQADANAAASSVVRMADLPLTRAQFLGRKGAVTALMQWLGRLPADAKPLAGAEINALKVQVEMLFDATQARLEAAALEAALSARRVDATLPGRVAARGATHPIQAVLDDLVDLLGRLGFELTEGPEVESEQYNFDLLNMPASHPARDIRTHSI